jgi:hypothetical protein
LIFIVTWCFFFTLRTHTLTSTNKNYTSIMATVMMYKNFDASKISCGVVNKNRAGGNQVSLMYNEKRGNIIIQTPTMRAPFGLSEYVPENGGEPKYSIDASFNGYSDDPKIRMFLDVVKAIDEHMVAIGVEHSVEWFGKKMSREVVEELYRPLIKESKEPEKYAPTCKCKIRDIHKVEAFTKNREPYSVSDLLPGSSIRMILEFSPIWFVNKQFGVTLNLIQFEFLEAPAGKLDGFSFVDDDDL